MVAIVVILAAVIAAFVFGMAGSSGTSKNIGMTVTTKMGTGATAGQVAGLNILWQGGSDINSLNSIQVKDGANNALAPAFNAWVPTGATHPSTGDVSAITYTAAIPQGTRTLIVGTFSDGSTQVIYDKVI